MLFVKNLSHLSHFRLKKNIHLCHYLIEFFLLIKKIITCYWPLMKLSLQNQNSFPLTNNDTYNMNFFSNENDLDEPNL